MTTEPVRTTILLADDHTLFRAAIRDLLATEPDLEVVGESASGDATVSLAQRHRPDVLLLDVEMPGPGLIATMARVWRVSPLTQILVLSMHESAEIVRSALAEGASGYLSKTVTKAELIASVRSVAEGDAKVVLAVSRRTAVRLHGSARDPVLSARETEVLHLLARACSNAQIATRLHIAEGTVKRHLTNIYAKLDAVSRLDALRRATAAGLVDGFRFGQGAEGAEAERP
ncbi:MULTISPECIES: response regulator transcription factor [unclassified Streptomyces]|uniref:response regulator n=1 Tax=unclassified Streptomyces TaxID=2593676 RepID=UPI0022580DA7|nr:response regulator transcription factor [Streptomyces sp. NBC_00338]MCX5141816.1 response regulator transcription factor [Streptomyces sp. NBC_00338]